MKWVFISACLLSLLFVVDFLQPSPTLARTSGSPGGYSGSISEGRTCGTNGGCHGGGVTATNNILTSNIPESGYIPGMTYNINISFSEGTKTKYGFEVSAENATGIKQGVWSSLDNATKLLSNKNVTHTSTGAQFPGGTASWDITWEAPNNFSGPVTFSVVINAANGNNGSSGDKIYMEQVLVSGNVSSVLENPLSKVNLFPNPVSEYLNLSGVNSGTIIKIYDDRGRLVYEQTLLDEQQLNLASLTPGSYLLKLLANGYQKTSWIVKE